MKKLSLLFCSLFAIQFSYSQCSVDLGMDTVLFCEGDCVNLDASGAWISYQWSTGENTQSICANQSGTIMLAVEDNGGCIAMDSVYLIQLHYDAYSESSTVCVGEVIGLGANIYGSIEAVGAIFDTTYLPDGSGVNYETAIQIDGYQPGQTFDAANQYLEICATIEHSYLGDLEMMLTCPNGTNAVVFNSWMGEGISPAFAGGFGGGGTYLGDALDGGLGTPGIGWDYCFSDLALWGTLGQEFGLGNTQPTTISGGNAMTSGTYKAEDSFSVFDGCPLNGDWTITIRDNIGIDDGYIMFWGLGMSHELEAPTYFWSSGDTLQNIELGIVDSLVTVEMSIEGTTCIDSLAFVVNPYPEIMLGVDPSDCEGGNGVVNNLNFLDSLLMQVYDQFGTPYPPSLLDPGLYNVFLATPQGCETDTLIEVTVHIDSVENIEGATVVFPSQEFTYSVPHSECLNYFWTIDNGTINSGQGTNEVSVSWNDSISGWISVNMSETRDFGQELILYVGSATGITETSEIHLELGPNPTSDFIWIAADRSIESISVLDLSGRVLKKQFIQSKTIGLDLSSLPVGSYILKLQTENSEVMRRVNVIP